MPIAMIDYELALDIIDILVAAIIIIMASISWYYVGGFFISFKRTKEVPHSDKFTKFAILVPARNESAVIGNIINSLKKQTYPQEHFDVWFITEKEDDPTNAIATSNGYNYFVRDEITPKRKTKGFALQECIRYFKNNNIHYDAYMIFDADNVMDIDYLEKMNDVRQSGVEVAVGFRNFTNINKNWLTSGSAILFTYINSFTSKVRSMIFRKCVIAGTGYYINADIVDEAGGWIFTGMTEDIEVTTYCEYHNINMKYYPLINFYDEQSPSYKTNHYQHIRWIWGFLENRKRFKKGGKKHNANGKFMDFMSKCEFNLGIIPFIVACALNVLCIIASIILYAFSIQQAQEYSYTLLWHFGYQLGIMYLLFALVAIATIAHNYNRLKMTWWSILITVLTYFIYFVDLAAAFLHGLFVPRVRKTWTPIKHSGHIKDKRALKVSEEHDE